MYEMVNAAHTDFKLLTVKEVGERLRTSPFTVRRLVRRGEIPGLRVGGQIRVSEDELVEWLFDEVKGGRDGDSGSPA
jgi:excisionase family DNA binding protein